MLKKIGLGLVGLGVVVVAGGYLLPQKTQIQRSIEIEAPIQTTFHLVNNLKAHEQWSPWQGEDPTMVNTYPSISSGVGAVVNWKGDKVKTGSMTITESRENELIAVDLDFGDQGKAGAFWSFEPTGNAIKVTWGFESDNGQNPIKRYVGRFLVKGMLEKAYDQGLLNLKTVAEKEVARQAVVHEAASSMNVQNSGVTN